MRLFFLSLMARFSAWLASVTEKWRNLTPNDLTPAPAPAEEVEAIAATTPRLTEVASRKKQLQAQRAKIAQLCADTGEEAPDKLGQMRASEMLKLAKRLAPENTGWLAELEALADPAGETIRRQERELATLEAKLTKFSDEAKKKKEEEKETKTKTRLKVGVKVFISLILLGILALWGADFNTLLNGAAVLWIWLYAIPKHEGREGHSNLAAQIAVGINAFCVWLLVWKFSDSGWKPLVGIAIAALVAAANMRFSWYVLKKGISRRAATVWIIGAVGFTVAFTLNGIKAIGDWTTSWFIQPMKTAEVAVVTAVQQAAGAKPHPLSTVILLVVGSTIIALIIKASLAKRQGPTRINEDQRGSINKEGE